MSTRRELQKLACLRLKEAEALFNASCYDGCAYLCGYMVELALKAAVCATLEVEEYPDKGSPLRESFKTHEFDDSKLLAGMEQAFTRVHLFLQIGRSRANGDLSADTNPRELTIKSPRGQSWMLCGTIQMEF